MGFPYYPAFKWLRRYDTGSAGILARQQGPVTPTAMSALAEQVLYLLRKKAYRVQRDVKHPALVFEPG